MQKVYARTGFWLVAANATILTLFSPACVGDAPIGGSAADGSATDAGVLGWMDASKDDAADASSGPVGSPGSADTGSDRDSSNASDADAAVPGCDLSKPFGAPELPIGLNGANDESAISFTADELFGVVSEDSTGKYRIYTVSRSTASSAFAAKQLVESVSGATSPLIGGGGHQFDPALSSDGKTLVVEGAGPSGAGGYDLWIATRSTPSASFGAVGLLSLNSTQDDGSPRLAADGTLYFISARDTAGATGEPFRAAQSGAGFAAPMKLVGLTPTTGGVHNIVATATGLVVYFGSNRADPINKGSYDIFVATRATTADSFSRVRNVDELNGAGYDTPDWVSPDGCRLYFDSERAGGAGGRDIYVASKPPAP